MSIEAQTITYQQFSGSKLDYSVDVGRWANRHNYVISALTAESQDAALVDIPQQATTTDKTKARWQVDALGIGQATVIITADTTTGQKLIIKHELTLEGQ